VSDSKKRDVSLDQTVKAAKEGPMATNVKKSDVAKMSKT
jgi:hypothetical protein